jgi:hypothetical protein
MKWKYRNKYSWHKWFAWYPVRIGDLLKGEDVVWMQTIERKKTQYSYDYRLMK